MTDSGDSIERSVNSTTSSWLKQARNGDEDAWKRLDRTYRRLVCWWCGKSGVPAQDIDDLVQEVLTALARSLADLKHETFRAFLWTVTRNKINDYWRSTNNRPLAQGGSSLQEILANVEAESNRAVGSVDQATKILFDAVVELVKGEFSEKDWRAFWQLAVEDKPAAEVAEELGITRNQVYLAKSRILRRIRQEFADEGGDQAV